MASDARLSAAEASWENAAPGTNASAAADINKTLRNMVSSFGLSELRVNSANPIVFLCRGGGGPWAKPGKIRETIKEATMQSFSKLTKGIIAMSALASTSAFAATFIYVSNAEDGEIGAYAMQAVGAVAPLARMKAAKVVMPMAVS